MLVGPFDDPHMPQQHLGLRPEPDLGRARPLRAEEERVAGWCCAALRRDRRDDACRQQEVHIDVL